MYDEVIAGEDEHPIWFIVGPATVRRRPRRRHAAGLDDVLHEPPQLVVLEQLAAHDHERRRYQNRNGERDHVPLSDRRPHRLVAVGRLLGATIVVRPVGLDVSCRSRLHSPDRGGRRVHSAAGDRRVRFGHGRGRRANRVERARRGLLSDGDSLDGRRLGARHRQGRLNSRPHSRRRSTLLRRRSETRVLGGGRAGADCDVCGSRRDKEIRHMKWNGVGYLRRSECSLRGGLMNARLTSPLLAAVAVAGIALVPLLTAASQDEEGRPRPKTAAKANVKCAPAPRTAEGKVDFSGIWSPDRNFIYDVHDALKKGEALPLQPWAEKLARERMSKDDPEAACLPTGVPRQAPYPWRIVQTRTHVFLLFEGNIHSYRQMYSVTGSARDLTCTESRVLA